MWIPYRNLFILEYKVKFKTVKNDLLKWENFYLERPMVKGIDIMLYD